MIKRFHQSHFLKGWNDGRYLFTLKEAQSNITDKRNVIFLGHSAELTATALKQFLIIN